MTEPARSLLRRDSDGYFLSDARSPSAPHSGIGRIFHLEDDPRERTGVRGDGPPASLEAMLTNGAAPERVHRVDDQTRRALEALGYGE